MGRMRRGEVKKHDFRKADEVVTLRVDHTGKVLATHNQNPQAATEADILCWDINRGPYSFDVAKELLTATGYEYATTVH